MNGKKKSNPQILFEDKEILVVNKPSGLVVNRDTSVKEKTLEDWIEERNLTGRAAHRLDKETSGVLIIAKSEKVLKNLQAQFKNREVKKTYLALVHGKVFPKVGQISSPIGRLPWNRERFGILPQGRPSHTFYKLIAYHLLASDRDRRDGSLITGEPLSLLEVTPHTGRTHQIRVHLKSIGHPIVSDSFYAGRKTSRKDRLWCPRLFLHASRVEFTHPVTGRPISVEAPLPLTLKQVLKTLSPQ